MSPDNKRRSTNLDFPEDMIINPDPIESKPRTAKNDPSNEKRRSLILECEFCYAQFVNPNPYFSHYQGCVPKAAPVKPKQKK
ncbi:hypothetical protein LPJ53_002181 [Coemansia erecta]|uniref:Uncharacterized protein n=1 Tax=Coemansia erecta TaxID=147472 RepID=A0A9W7Y3U3_9FUNG|nr:hypothetical protein LPJ53_002181 [Coemansia erecta]